MSDERDRRRRAGVLEVRDELEQPRCERVSGPPQQQRRGHDRRGDADALQRSELRCVSLLKAAAAGGVELAGAVSGRVRPTLRRRRRRLRGSASVLGRRVSASAANGGLPPTHQTRRRIAAIESRGRRLDRRPAATGVSTSAGSSSARPHVSRRARRAGARAICRHRQTESASRRSRASRSRRRGSGFRARGGPPDRTARGRP